MDCRIGCGACCIAPSINSPLPGMPNGKAAGERCLHLNSDNLCLLFGRSERPSFCDRFSASKETCGESFDEAMVILIELQQATD